MELLRKGRDFLAMLEGKQRFLTIDIAKSNNKLNQIKTQLAVQYQEIKEISQGIKSLTPEGVVSRSDIYSGIRQQGSLLMKQQYVLQKVSELEAEKQTQEQLIEQQQHLLNQIDKKLYKLNIYMQRLQRDFIRKSDNAMEIEIEESRAHGK